MGELSQTKPYRSHNKSISRSPGLNFPISSSRSIHQHKHIDATRLKSAVKRDEL